MEVINNIPDFLEFFSLQHPKDNFTKHQISFEILSTLGYDDWLLLVPAIGARIKLAEHYPKARGETRSNLSFVGTEDLSLNLNISSLNNGLLHEEVHTSSPKRPNKGARKELLQFYPSASDEMKQQPELSEDSLVNLDVSAIEEHPSDEQTGANPPKKKRRTNPRFFKGEVSLKEFLQCSGKTSTFMQQFDFEQGELTDKQRRTIVNTIVDGMMDRHDKISYEMFADCATAICDIFPKEYEYVYFKKPCKKTRDSSATPPRGKLYDKVHNERFKQRDLIKSITKKKPPVKTAPSKDIVFAKHWLKHNHSPSELVDGHWETSRPLRITESADDDQFITFLEQWPIFKNSDRGPVLVSYMIEY